MRGRVNRSYPWSTASSVWHVSPRPPAMAWAARDYAAAISYEPVGPRAFPLLLAALLAIGGSWLVLRPTLRGGPPCRRADPGDGAVRAGDSCLRSAVRIARLRARDGRDGRAGGHRVRRQLEAVARCR